MTKTPGSEPARDVVSRALRHAYLRTEVTIELDGKTVSAPVAAKRTSRPIHVVSAANPRSAPTDGDTNAELYRSLVDVLTDARVEHWPALGRDPFSEWAEPSIALPDTSRKQAQKLGRRFDQFAVFEISTKSITVHGCLSRWKISRPHGRRALPENDDTLADAVARSLGIVVDAELRRFRRKGWRLVGTIEFVCPTCTSPSTELFATVHQQKNGKIIEHLTLICSVCRTATPTTSLTTDERWLVERWRDHRLAIDDAMEAGLGTPSYRCYVVRLGRPDDRWVYVGETSKSAEDRLAEHQAGGARANAEVRDHGVDLRKDLMAGLPEFPDRLSSQTYERYLAAKLHHQGFTVAGGH